MMVVVQLDFRMLVEAALDPIGVLDREQRLVFANPALAGALGAPAAALVGASAELWLAAGDAAAWRAAVAGVLGGATAEAAVAHTLETPRGPRRFAAHIAALPGTGACAVWRDITDVRAGQGAAPDSAQLLAAEHLARRHAEAARDRARRLQALTAAMSGASERSQVVSILADAGRAALGAMLGVAWLLQGDTLELAAPPAPDAEPLVERFRAFSLAARLPVCDAVRMARPLMFESLAAMKAAYPDADPAPESPGRAWAVVPVVVGGRGVGAVSFSFAGERAFSEEDGELLGAMAGQASLALERCALVEALRASEAQLRVALVAARAATWKLDLATMESTRDPSYLSLVGAREALATVDFGPIHPDDREAARAHLERALREGVPYEPEVRLRRGDGTYLWVRAHGRLVYGADGAPSALAGVVVDIDEAKRASLRAEEERRINETLHRLGSSFARELDHGRLVQLITDEVGALVGAERAAFIDARLAEEAPWPARSQLAVPVIGRSGERFGALLFGHAEAGRFTAEHERLAASIASQAAVALENARLYQTVREQNQQLALAVERVREADRRKDEFLAMLGHELRNPLAPIATALELMSLKSGALLQKERDVIHRQVAHLSRLLDDLLDVSRITRGKIRLALQVIEIGAVLAQAIETVRPLLEKRMQPLAIDVPREGLEVDADPTRLAQVFQNLLTNAARYSAPGAPIAVRARGQGDRVIVDVTDRGIGIPEDVLPHLFDLFVQGERTIDRADGGLGIGLTIARSLCELHGGTIGAASEGRGWGSTFTVTLRRAAGDAGTAPARAGGRGRRGATGARVLVVDDNIDAAQLLSELLAELGYEAMVAHDGPAALALAGAFQPDVAVLDIGLPVMDGYELARRLREQLGVSPLRLIAVTGYGQDGDRARAREAGFDHHLVKPVALDALAPLLTDGR